LIASRDQEVDMISMKWLYWAAGVIEGEGCFTHHRNGDLVISVVMTDNDVIKRLRGTFGFGSMTQRSLPSGKIAFSWRSTNQAQTGGLMMTLLPLMSARRQVKIIECLDAWRSKPLRKALWSHCKNGHELAGDNLWITHEGKYEKRRCRECNRLRQAKYKAKQEKPAAVPRIVSTHCKHGHELAGDNLRVGRDGKYEYRTCGECARLRQAKYRAKMREQMEAS
jgi:hypothetical protein